jgi:hypothetical protein
MRMWIRFASWFAMAPMAFLPAEALAARLARTRADTPLYQEASTSSAVIATIPKGAKVATSTSPTNGFYRAKAASTGLGWIQEGSLQFEAPAAAPSAGKGEAPRTRARGKGGRHGDSTRLRLFGDMDLFNVSDVNTSLNIDTMKAGIGYGLEGILMLNPRLGLVLRLEKIAKSTLVLTETGSQSFDMSVSSMPVMAGLEYDLVKRDPHDPEGGFSLSFSGLGGMGLNTKLSSIYKEGTTGPNETIYGGSAVTFMGKLNANVYVAKSTALTAEIGYRMLKTAKAGPTTTGLGADIFKDPSNPAADYDKLSIDLSGLVIGAGLTIGF